LEGKLGGGVSEGVQGGWSGSLERKIKGERRLEGTETQVAVQVKVVEGQGGRKKLVQMIRRKL